MSSTLTTGWDLVDEYVYDAHLIAWDTCHKIYVAMDEIEADWFRENYEAVVEGSPEQLSTTLREWFDAACPLRFIQAVHHDAVDPNAGFTNLIEQGSDGTDEVWDDEDEDEDEEEEDE